MTEEHGYALLAAALLRKRGSAPESRLSRDEGIRIVEHAMVRRARRARFWRLFSRLSKVLTCLTGGATLLLAHS